MPAQPPILDKRTLPQLVQQLLGAADTAFSGLPALLRWHYAKALSEEEVRALLSRPLDDAGLMLALIYARLFELALQRLNQAPEKNLLAFLDTMGVSLLPPSPARVPLTFALLPGSLPVRIPKGTQAGTRPSAQQSAVFFETEDDFTAIPARLALGFTVDPTWDRYTDQTPLLGGQSSVGFTPFVGARRMPHILFLGDDALLNFRHSVSAEVRFTWQAAHTRDEIRRFFERLSYRYLAQGVARTISPTFLPGPGGNQATLKFDIAETIDPETIQGVGLAQGVTGRWLQGVLTTPFPDASVAQELKVNNLHLRVSASGLLPDLAFGNTAPLDVTKDFLPFGETPKVGDAFYIASQDIFAKPGATVTLSAEVKATPPPTLAWEYWDGERWEVLPKSRVVDNTQSFTKSGRISLLVPVPSSKEGSAGSVAAGSTAMLRVRMAGGRYQGAPVVKMFALVTTTELMAPVEPNTGEILVRERFFAAPGQVLVVDEEGKEEHAVVIGLTKGIEKDNVLMVKPHFMDKHKEGRPVKLRATVPATSLTKEAKQGTTQLVVATTEGISLDDILLLDDIINPEFVKVINITSKVNISIAAPLRFQHNSDLSLARVIEPHFLGFANGDWLDFTRQFQRFHPFGKNPGDGDLFMFLLCDCFSASWVPYAGSIAPVADEKIGLRKFPLFARYISRQQLRINVDVELTLERPHLELRWEFLGADGWLPISITTDGTDGFREGGTIDIDLSSGAPILAEINGQMNCWLRARITKGHYGLPVEFEPVDPSDSAKGFRIRAGTGNVNPPVITKLALGYRAECPPTVLTQNGFLYRDETTANKGAGFTPFVSVKEVSPQIYADGDPALYLGFDAAFPEQPVTLYASSSPRAFTGSVIKEIRTAPAPPSALPPLSWEYFNGTAWKELTLFDRTSSLTESGTLEFLTPVDIAPLARFDLTARYWIRARSPENDPFVTQQIAGLFLNTVPAVEGVTVQGGTLGSGSGEGGQTLHFARIPLLGGEQVLVRETNPPSETERAAIEAEEREDAIQERVNAVTGEKELWVRWHEVSNFLSSDPYSRHYTLDRATGVLTFGDGKRGLIPPRGTNNIAATYRTGSGAAGNVAMGAVAQMKSPLPGVVSVTSPVAADGGADSETLPAVRERGPQTLRHRCRAVACADLEGLARQAAGTRVARARSLPNVNRDLRFEPGWVTLIIVPQGGEAKLAPGSELIRAVEDYLEARAFVGLASPTPARVNVIGPGYVQVAVEAEVVPRDIDEAEEVKGGVIKALARFFHPLTGGPNGTGWEFGRNVYASEVCQLLEGVPGASHVKTLRLVPNAAQRRLTLASAPVAAMDLPEGSAVMTADRRKGAQLAEAVPMGAAVGRIAVKGFKEGDRIAKVLDLVVQSVSGTTVTVVPFAGDAVGFPRGSLVTSFDGAGSTRLDRAIPRNEAGLTGVAVEDADFASRLAPGDILTVFYPFPMTVTSVEMESVAGVLTLGLDPYEAKAGFPAGSTMATLDNRVRLPLAAAVPAGQPVTSLQLLDFARSDGVILTRRDGAAPALGAAVLIVEPVEDIVCIDDNFLVYPGKHSIRMMAR